MALLIAITANTIRTNVVHYHYHMENDKAIDVKTPEPVTKEVEISAE